MATGDTSSLVDLVFLENCFAKFREMKESQEQCDVTLLVGGREFRAHRAVLVGASEYFCKLFDEKYAEGMQGRFVISDYDADAMSAVLDFIYSGILDLDDSNFIEILQISDYLGIEIAKEACAEYAMENVRPENSVETYILGDMYGLPDVRRLAKTTIVSHLDAVYETEPFLELPIDFIENILTKELGCHDKELLCRTLLRWVQHDVPSRKKFLKKLLSTVAQEYVSLDFFVNNICKERLLCEDLESVNWVTGGLFKKCREVLANVPCSDTVFITERHLLESSTYKFHFPSKTKYDWGPRPPVCYFSAACYQNAVYIAGGYISDRTKELSNQSFKCSRRDGIWTPIGFDCPRAYAGTSVLRDRWYVIGGMGDTPACAYDFCSDQTLKISKISGPRKQPGVINYNGSLFICGGYVEPGDRFSRRKYLNVVERYDPREGQLETVHEFAKVKGICSATVVTDYLFCLSHGGFLERLDFRFYESELWPTTGLNGDWLTTVSGKLFAVSHTGILQNIGAEWINIAPMVLLLPMTISC